jgi:hypothetical protein
VCRNTAAAQVLCTLLFPDGSWETASQAARTASFRLLRSGRTFATGKAVLRAGNVRVRLMRTRTIRAGTYRLQMRIAGAGRTERRVVLRAVTGRVVRR